MQAGAACAVGVGAIAYAGAAGMTLWSVAGNWRFPNALPSNISVGAWSTQAHHALATATTTVLIGATAVIVAVAAALACLETRQQRGAKAHSAAEWLIYAPLLVPQIAFLFGVQIVLVRVGLDGSALAVVWTHVMFVLPYVFLSLADPFMALDPRYVASAAALGAGPVRIFFAIKLPLLARSILAAATVGFGVSLAQYLPTLFAGAGRVTTLTTEAVTLSSGADRRVIGVFAMLQAALPLAAYALAFAGPALLFRKRRGMLV